MTVPVYIDADHIPDEPEEAVVWLGDLAYGGCRAATYLPAVEYHHATQMMAQHWRAILCDDTKGVGWMRDYHRPAHNRTAISRDGGWTLYPEAQISLADEHLDGVTNDTAQMLRKACGWDACLTGPQHQRFRASHVVKSAYAEFCAAGWMQAAADYDDGVRSVHAFYHVGERRLNGHDMEAISDVAGAIACAALAARVELWAWQTMSRMGVSPRADRAVRRVTS
jgi:hypothetical protein